MKGFLKFRSAMIMVLAVAFLSGCAAPGTYYSPAAVTPPPIASDPLRLGYNDHRYVIQIHDNTPFGIIDLPATQDLLYSKGYDRVRKQRSADFVIEAHFTAGAQDNPNVRAGQTIAGAVTGAALGAIIGGAAAGEAGAGAAIGAAGGAAVGLAAPAYTAFVHIDLNIYSLTDQTTTRRSSTVDLTSVPPPDAALVIDREVARMVSDLPPL